jgi:sugar lactone lactonase YvrE
MTETRATLGEGAIWSSRDQALYWVDIVNGEVQVFEPATRKARVFPIGQVVGTIVRRRAGGLILALHHGVAAFHLDSGELDFITEDVHKSTDHRLNDGKCDPAGRLWVGTIALGAESGTSALYRINSDHSVHRVCAGVTNSNGIAWSLDNSTMYYIDTPTRQISAFDYDVVSGNIRNRRVAITVPEELGYPDGMTIDSQGKLWIALWGGGCVSRWDPISGVLLATLELPVRQVTSCAFGGPDLTDLYVTTARLGMDELTLCEQPLAGALFRFQMDVAGVEAFEFAG